MIMKNNDSIGYLFIAPNLLIYTIFIFIPFIYTFILSFTDYNLFRFAWIGFRNYGMMFRDDIFLRSIWNTLRFSLGTILPSIVIGLLFAVLLNRGVRLRLFFRTLIFIPNIISVVTGALAWAYILDSSPVGIANRIIAFYGFPPQKWLLDLQLAMPSVIAMSVWAGIGFNMLVYMVGLQGIPSSLYEAAAIDGAPRIRTFFSITLPLLKPTSFFLLVMACIRSFQVFGQVYIMTGGGPLNTTTTIVHQIFQNGFQGYRMGYASAQSVFLLLIILTVTLINFKSGNNPEGADAD